jgi:hypothetical protein
VDFQEQVADQVIQVFQEQMAHQVIQVLPGLQVLPGAA